MFFTQGNNLTEITEFFLLGFQIRQYLRIFLLFLLLVVFCWTICGNILVITLVSTSKNLHTPMYFFISHLAISDIFVTTEIAPQLILVIANNGTTIHFIGCITQFYILCALGVFQIFLLTVMSYDRYLAICNPLRYTSIMTSSYCVKVVSVCWSLGLSISFILNLSPSTLTFCGSNIIDHVYCDLIPLLELACSDTFITHLVMYSIGFPIVFIPTSIIVVSYTYIVISVLRISSSTGRQKAFSTCSSHLIVVSIFYWSIFSVYVVPTKGQNRNINKILAMLYTVFTPIINPIVYSLRNKDIMKAVRETLQKNVIL